MTLGRHCNSQPWSLYSYLCACMVLSALLTLLNTLKTRYWHFGGNVRLRTLVLLFTASTWGDCSFFLYLHFYFLLFVFVCFSVHLLVCLCVCVCVCHSACLSMYVSVCLCVCVFVCLSVRVSVCMSLCIMYYVYMYVVFIVINVCKLLHVRRPTSSPRAVWNPCKINKALN